MTSEHIHAIIAVLIMRRCKKIQLIVDTQNSFVLDFPARIKPEMIIDNF